MTWLAKIRMAEKWKRRRKWPVLRVEECCCQIIFLGAIVIFLFRNIWVRLHTFINTEAWALDSQISSEAHVYSVDFWLYIICFHAELISDEILNKNQINQTKFGLHLIRCYSYLVRTASTQREWNWMIKKSKELYSWDFVSLMIVIAVWYSFYDLSFKLSFGTLHVIKLHTLNRWSSKVNYLNWRMHHYSLIPMFWNIL